MDTQEELKPGGEQLLSLRDKLEQLVSKNSASRPESNNTSNDVSEDLSRLDSENEKFDVWLQKLEEHFANLERSRESIESTIKKVVQGNTDVLNTYPELISVDTFILSNFGQDVKEVQEYKKLVTQIEKDLKPWRDQGHDLEGDTVLAAKTLQGRLTQGLNENRVKQQELYNQTPEGKAEQAAIARIKERHSLWPSSIRNFFDSNMVGKLFTKDDFAETGLDHARILSLIQEVFQERLKTEFIDARREIDPSNMQRFLAPEFKQKIGELYALTHAIEQARNQAINEINQALTEVSDRVLKLHKALNGPQYVLGGQTPLERAQEFVAHSLTYWRGFDQEDIRLQKNAEVLNAFVTRLNSGYSDPTEFDLPNIDLCIERANQILDYLKRLPAIFRRLIDQPQFTLDNTKEGYDPEIALEKTIWDESRMQISTIRVLDRERASKALAQNEPRLSDLLNLKIRSDFASEEARAISRESEHQEAFYKAPKIENDNNVGRTGLEILSRIKHLPGFSILKQQGIKLTKDISGGYTYEFPNSHIFSINIVRDNRRQVETRKKSLETELTTKRRNLEDLNGKWFKSKERAKLNQEIEKLSSEVNELQQKLDQIAHQEQVVLEITEVDKQLKAALNQSRSIQLENLRLESSMILEDLVSYLEDFFRRSAEKQLTPKEIELNRIRTTAEQNAREAEIRLQTVKEAYNQKLFQMQSRGRS